MGQCGHYFAVMHEIQHDESITHPNQYFDKSQTLIEGRTNEGTPKPSQNRSSQKPAKENAVKRNKKHDLLMDEYDDDLWNVSQAVERSEKSKLDVASAMADDDDYDMSQIIEEY